MSERLVELTDITTGYDGVAAIEHVNLTINERDYIGIIGPNGGSATQYFIGDFDGKTFKPDALPYPLWIDYGRDNYAGVTWSNIPEADGRTIFIGWMSNWDYANQVPSKYFRSANTVPRELKLASNGNHLILTSYPVKEINALKNKEKNLINDVTVTTEYRIEKLLDGNEEPIS